MFSGFVKKVFEHALSSFDLTVGFFSYHLVVTQTTFPHCDFVPTFAAFSSYIFNPGFTDPRFESKVHRVVTRRV